MPSQRFWGSPSVQDASCVCEGEQDLAECTKQLWDCFKLLKPLTLGFTGDRGNILQFQNFLF